MSRGQLTHIFVTLELLFGYRDPIPRHGVASLRADNDIPSDSDDSTVAGPWKDGDQRDRSEAEVDFRVPKIMADVMRYIRSIDINTL